MRALTKDGKFITVKETAHKKVVFFVLFFAFINGSAFGFGIAHLILEYK
ncbi:hypothetical protein LCGC14_1376340 [marine sediment metagenome]|uniref:Uncharacterized protein n=1 Tax=marine sediment metagenome TaxID=412755 RepID=A0A0F9K4D7_9ZZZZ